MFPTPPTRLRTAFRRSLDAAIEFATLGEYGWSDAWEAPDATDRLRAGAANVSSGAPADQVRSAPGVRLLKPSSAAARAAVERDRRSMPADCAGWPLRGRALESKLPRPARSRDGMALREQWCRQDD